MQGQVEVRESLWHAWADNDYAYLNVAFFSEMPAREAVGSLQQVIDDLLDDLENDEFAVLWPAVPVPGGAAFEIEDDLAQMPEIVPDLVRRLQDRGLRGTLDAFTSEVPQEIRRSSELLTDLLEFRISLMGRSMHGAADSPIRWQTPSRIWSSMIEMAKRWCAEGDAERLYLGDINVFYRVEASDIEELMWASLAGKDPHVRLCGESGARYRFAAIERDQGYAVFVEGGERVAGDNWPSVVGDMKDLFAAASQVGVYGFVKRGQQLQSALLANSLEYDWTTMTHVPERVEWWTRPYEDAAVPDAFGLQMLGPSHLDRVPDGPDWVTTTVDEQHVAVAHRSPSSWFQQPLPPQPLLDGARRDFADLLITAASVADYLRTNPGEER